MATQLQTLRLSLRAMPTDNLRRLASMATVSISYWTWQRWVTADSIYSIHYNQRARAVIRAELRRRRFTT